MAVSKDQRREKIRTMIAEEAAAVETDDLAGYMDSVIQAVAILKQIFEAGELESMPREKVIDMIDAAGSTLIFSRELLTEVQKLIR